MTNNQFDGHKLQSPEELANCKNSNNIMVETLHWQKTLNLSKFQNVKMIWFLWGSGAYNGSVDNYLTFAFNRITNLEVGPVINQ
jgi:hypothetical protein